MPLTPSADKVFWQALQLGHQPCMRGLDFYMQTHLLIRFVSRSARLSGPVTPMGVCMLAFYQGLCTTRFQVEEPRRRWKPKPGKFVRELKRRLSQLENKERMRDEERKSRWPPGMPPGPPPGRPPDLFAAGTAAASTGDFALDAIPNLFCMYPRRLSVCYIVAFSDNSHLVKPVAGAGAATGPVPPCFFGIGVEVSASFGVRPSSPGAAEGSTCSPAREAVPVPVNAGISLRTGCVLPLFCSAACDVPTVTSAFKDAEAPAVNAVPVENNARVVEAVPVVAGARTVETMPWVPRPRTQNHGCTRCKASLPCCPWCRAQALRDRRPQCTARRAALTFTTLIKMVWFMASCACSLGCLSSMLHTVVISL